MQETAVNGAMCGYHKSAQRAEDLAKVRQP